MSQQINLFNPVFLKQRKIFTTLAMAQALGVLVVGIVVLAWYGQRSVDQLRVQAEQTTTQLQQRQARLKAATAQFAPRGRNAALEAQVADLEIQVRALREAGGRIRGGAFGSTEGYAGYFRAFARQDTPGLWLTGLSIDGAGIDINIEGRALDASIVPGYITALSAEPVLKGKTFGSLRITTPAAQAEPSVAAAPAAAPRPLLAPFVEFQLRAEPVEAGG